MRSVREAEEDSWEDASDGDFGGGLTQLRAMYWAEMPLPQQKYVEENCPRLTLRTTDTRPPGSVPPEPGSRCPWPALDLPLAEAVGPAAWRALHQQADAALAAREVPIAERFKAAIDEAELIAANKAAAAAKKVTARCPLAIASCLHVPTQPLSLTTHVWRCRRSGSALRSAPSRRRTRRGWTRMCCNHWLTLACVQYVEIARGTGSAPDHSCYIKKLQAMAYLRCAARHLI